MSVSIGLICLTHKLLLASSSVREFGSFAHVFKSCQYTQVVRMMQAASS